MTPPPSSLPRPPRLMLRFAVYTGVVLALAGTASVWLAARQVAAREQRSVWSDARFVAERLGRDDLARLGLERPVSGDRRAELDELFGREALGPEATRVTLFRRDGRVTYSTDHTLIGTVHPDPATIDSALAGEEVYGVARVGEQETLESYVPVHWLLADPDWAAGVLRVSRDYGPVQDEIRQGLVRQAAMILLALLLLYVSLFPILRRVTRTLAERNRSLEVSEARWRALTEQASDAIFVVDDEARVLQANERACLLLGRPLGAILGRGFGDFVEADDLAQVPLRLAELRAGTPIFQERRLLRADGSVVATELSAGMLDDGRILAIVRDVTERAELEEERRRALRAAATERLAAGIAHDFDRVLAGIAGYGEHLLDRLDGDHASRGLVERIRETTARGAELTAQLRTFGRRRLARAEVLELSAVIASMEPRLRSLAGEQVELVTRVDPDVGRIEADPDEIRHLLLELVLSACDAMPEGGRVTLAAANVDFARRRRTADGDARVDPGEHVMVSISDTASGANGEEERLSLGLAAVFGLVQRSGGTVGVESEPGRGTTLRVYLPRVDAPVRPASPQAPGDVPAGTETILVVEDEQIVRAVVREMLEAQGYTVLEAATEAEARDLAADADLLLSLSGLERPFTHESLARAVRQALTTS